MITGIWKELCTIWYQPTKKRRLPYSYTYVLLEIAIKRLQFVPTTTF
jgi:hypothetical protein